MKVVYPLGTLALVGAVFLALGALSASARAGLETPAETHANAVTSTPVVLTPPVVTPTPVPPEPWPVPVPVPSADATPIRTLWDVSMQGDLQPIVGDPLTPPVPPPAFPPPVTLEG